MKLVFGSLLVAAMTAVGCAHTEVTTMENVPSNKPGIIYLKAGDRAPAGAPQLVWGRGTVNISVTGASPSGSATSEAKVNQEMIWTETEYFTDYRAEYQEVVVPGTCSDFQCTQSAGKSELWDAFYSASGDRKAAALDAAISGIGEVSAKNLVAKGYFKSKPRSWAEFSREINMAADRNVIKRSIATMVLENNRYENITKLGYAGNTCQEVKRSCDLVISKLVQVPFQNSRDIQKRRIVETRTFNVTVNVTGALLMQSEKDVITVKVDEMGKVVAVDGEGYNTYAMTNSSANGQNVVVDVKAVNRILRPLPNNLIRQESFVLVGDKPTFVLDVDPQFIPGGDDPNAQLVIDYTVQVCEYGWTGTCGFSSWKNLKMASAVITGARTTLQIEVPRKNKSQLLYRVTRKNSIFFDSKGLSERESDEVKAPK
ncbi:hypothetical protein [Bdellovibrio sp. KM01]|uniref:hypothetical protein n=1 Tax=Bdellovibrio sp. KM01 TaxID=2748865 RepID=UPI0015E91630|nr:hypothetical protein [Bdellovibrio sp. KM01]QLY25813.1 hypothetical protein HW988_01850 [Bdellovibrio sp. KM01]